MTVGPSRLAATLGALLLITSAGCGRSAPPPAPAPAPAASAPKVSHVFRGTVKGLDATARTLSVANENVPGWMDAMTMSYGVSNPDVLSSIKVGDVITATVYDGDFQTLHDVKVVGPSAPAH